MMNDGPFSVPVSDGLIEAVGPADAIESEYSRVSFDRVIDAAGMCVLPGECGSSPLTRRPA